MSENTGLIEFTDENLQEYIDTGKPVLIDFWATWCGPCKMISPIVEDIANEVGEGAIIGKMNIEQNTSGTKYGVMALPTLVFFKDGKKQNVLTGVPTKAKIQKTLNKYLD